jgi:hypothetical protein
MLSSSTNLTSIYKVAKRFPGCMEGGGISEEVSDDVVVRLAHHWRNAIRELQERRADHRFVTFVLQHVDATTDPDDLRKVESQSKAECPRTATRLCREIASAAREALKDQ